MNNEDRQKLIDRLETLQGLCFSDIESWDTLNDIMSELVLCWQYIDEVDGPSIKEGSLEYRMNKYLDDNMPQYPNHDEPITDENLLKYGFDLITESDDNAVKIWAKQWGKYKEERLTVHTCLLGEHIALVTIETNAAGSALIKKINSTQKLERLFVLLSE